MVTAWTAQLTEMVQTAKGAGTITTREKTDTASPATATLWAPEVFSATPKASASASTESPATNATAAKSTFTTSELTVAKSADVQRLGPTKTHQVATHTKEPVNARKTLKANVAESANQGSSTSTRTTNSAVHLASVSGILQNAALQLDFPNISPNPLS